MLRPLLPLLRDDSLLQCSGGGGEEVGEYKASGSRSAPPFGSDGGPGQRLATAQ